MVCGSSYAVPLHPFEGVLHGLKARAVVQWDLFRDLPRPMDATGVRSFIGFVNYFRQFIDKYAETCAPLHELTKQKVEWKWTDVCEQASITLKQKLCDKPVLAMPDVSPGHATFRLQTDWSKTAIGAALLQKDSRGKEHAIAYASRILRHAPPILYGSQAQSVN